MGSDRDIPDAVGGYPEFQSTLPAWGATSTFGASSGGSYISIHAPRMGSDAFETMGSQMRPYFNPRSPHGERLAARRKGKRQRGISIHAPRMGSDPQTTAPSDTGFISIHAPRMGSDLSDRSRENKMSISIHAPRMGSDSTRFKSNIANAVFQSTLPAWGATYNCR